MQKIIINATVTVRDDLDLGLLQRIISAVGETSSVSFVSVQYQPIGDRTRFVWVQATTDDSEPYVLVKEPYSFEGIELPDEAVTTLMQEGVCTGLRANYPRADRYGVPNWAANPGEGSAEMAASMQGFFIAEEGFDAVCTDTRDDSAESFWYHVALPEDSTFMQYTAAASVDEEAAGDALWADMSSETKTKVDDLYSEACERNSCYEAVVLGQFCSAMDGAFGSRTDRQSLAAFAYARHAYGYMTSDEIKAQQAKDWTQGICSHGLDVKTCPCGCFEFDDEDDSDYVVNHEEEARVLLEESTPPTGTTMNTQELCDRIRRNLTEKQMQDALEGAGFAVHESGQELVEALCTAIEQGDVSESVLDM